MYRSARDTSLSDAVFSAAGLLSKGQELTQALLSQVDPQPCEQARRQWDERWVEQPDANVRSDRAAEITSQQHSAEHGGLRNQIERDACELNDSDGVQIVRQVADPLPFANVECGVREFPSRARQQDENGNDRNHAAGPHNPSIESPRGRCRVRSRGVHRRTPVRRNPTTFFAAMSAGVRPISSLMSTFAP